MHARDTAVLIVVALYLQSGYTGITHYYGECFDNYWQWRV